MAVRRIFVSGTNVRRGIEAVSSTSRVLLQTLVSRSDKSLSLMEKKRRFFWIKKSLMERDEAVIINQEESHGEYQTAGEAHAYQQLKDMQSREHAQHKLVAVSKK